MKILAKGWGTRSDIRKPEFQRLIEELKIKNWSRRWEYPFIILHSDIQLDLKILDGGCVGSPLPAFCIRKNCEVWGVDVDECNVSGLHYRIGDIRSLSFESDYFDRVICTSVIEHIKDDPMVTIRELLRVLKPGGLLSITTDINRGDGSYSFHPTVFNVLIGRNLGLDLGEVPKDVLRSETTKLGRICGPGLSVFGFVLEK